MFAIISPSGWGRPNLSFFRLFVDFLFREHNQPSDLNAKSISPETIRTAKITSYENFIKHHSFKGGYVAKQISGKYSYLRLRVLGSTVNGIRGTLIVSDTLPPNAIAINQVVYDKLDLAVPFVFLNRDPSINSRCMYVCDIIPYQSNTDRTIHVNQYVLEGLNGDQDGDDVNLYYLKKEDEVPSITMVTAIAELHRKSWTHGNRHDTLGRPRYTFSQQQKLMLHIYKRELCALSPFWNSLQQFPNPHKMVFDLGCFTHRDELDDFLEIFAKFCRENNPGIATYRDLLTGGGLLQATVDSQAKGSAAHIEKYLQNLVGISDSDMFLEATQTFNKFVMSNSEMKICGHQLFIMLHIYQNVTLMCNSIYMNDTIIAHDIDNNEFFSVFLYRPSVVIYPFTLLITGAYDDE
ncbi:MAG: hypothetical protein MUO31_05505 [Thermodesulfovibrionales bacterium]|nr:hypothetical protein [Thermodesulfovibrionales bacterium]